MSAASPVCSSFVRTWSTASSTDLSDLSCRRRVAFGVRPKYVLLAGPLLYPRRLVAQIRLELRRGLLVGGQLGLGIVAGVVRRVGGGRQVGRVGGYVQHPGFRVRLLLPVEEAHRLVAEVVGRVLPGRLRRRASHALVVRRQGRSSCHHARSPTCRRRADSATCSNSCSGRRCRGRSWTRADRDMPAACGPGRTHPAHSSCARSSCCGSRGR